MYSRMPMFWSGGSGEIKRRKRQIPSLKAMNLSGENSIVRIMWRKEGNKEGRKKRKKEGREKGREGERQEKNKPKANSKSVNYTGRNSIPVCWRVYMFHKLAAPFS